jgi:hypothetical protein
VSYNRGACIEGKNGTYVNGTIDEKSFSYDANTKTLSFSYRSANTGGLARGFIGNVTPPSGVSNADRLNALVQGTRMAEPGVNLAANGLEVFGYVVAGPVMALAECAAAGRDCSVAGTALAIIPIPLTGGARKLLGGILPLADETVADAIRLRGGGGAQVNKVASSLQQKTVAEVANLAAKGDAEARTAIKIIKNAARLAQK